MINLPKSKLFPFLIFGCTVPLNRLPRLTPVFVMLFHSPLFGSHLALSWKKWSPRSKTRSRSGRKPRPCLTKTTPKVSLIYHNCQWKRAQFKHHKSRLRSVHQSTSALGKRSRRSHLTRLSSRRKPEKVGLSSPLVFRGLWLSVLVNTCRGLSLGPLSCVATSDVKIN